MKITPLADRVLIEPKGRVKESKGGIIIPDLVDEVIFEGTILAVGEGTSTEEMKVKVGEKIMHLPRQGTALKVENKTYLMIRQRDIMAIIDEFSSPI